MKLTKIYLLIALATLILATIFSIFLIDSNNANKQERNGQLRSLKIGGIIV